FRRNVVEGKHVGRVTLENKSLGYVLRHIARETGLTFKIIDENIYVTKKITNDTSAVDEIKIGPTSIDITVSGLVTDEKDGERLPGVNILVKGTTIGTTTDSEGRYNLTVPENSTLTFSFIGYHTREIPVNAQTVINVVMVADISELDEVVVIGYGTQKKEEITSSVSSITSEEFNDGVITSPL